jgi:hypothetical protein
MIFETAASHRPTACILVRVSKAVSAWITPILYFAVIIPHHHPSRRTDRDRIRAKRTWSHTRNLFLQLNRSHRLSDVGSDGPSVWGSPFPVHSSVPSFTYSLQSLVICNTDPHRHKLNFKSPALTHVIILGQVSYMHFPKELFRTVTHLYLADDFPRYDCVNLHPDNLPKLSHLITTVRTPWVSIPDVEYYKSAIHNIASLASTFKNIRVVAVHLADAYRDPAKDVDIASLCANLPFPLESQMLVKPSESFDEHIWKGWVNGSESVWDRADRELNMRCKPCPECDLDS